jgi:hypothetical protein
MKEHDSNSLQPARGDLGGDGFQRRTVEGNDLGAVEADPPRHLEDVPGRHRALRLDPAEKVGGAGNLRPADLHNMPESGSGDQSRACALTFEDRVGGDGRAVQHHGDRVSIGPGLREDLVGPAEKPGRGIAGNRGGLRDPKAAARALRQDHIGEGAADIEGEGEGRLGHYGPPVTGSV